MKIINHFIVLAIAGEVLVPCVSALRIYHKKKLSTNTEQKDPLNLLAKSKWLGKATNSFKLKNIPEEKRKKAYFRTAASKEMCSKIENETSKMKSYTPVVKYLKNKATGQVMKITKNDCYRFSFKARIRKQGAVRLDRDFSAGKWYLRRKFVRHKIKNSKIKQNKNKLGSGKKKKLMTGADAIKVIFECDLKDKNVCEKAKHAYESATKTIGSIVQVKKKIVVRARFISFCKNQIDCTGEILGQADASAHWMLDPKTSDTKVDSFFRYPQGLAKQLSNVKMDWAPEDILAEFNGDLATKGKDLFWFKGDKTPIRKDQYDFKYVVLHEMLHGMGFGSSWNTYIPSDNEDNPVPLLIPNFNFEDGKDGKMLVNGVNTPGIFDKFVHIKDGKIDLMESFYIMTDKGLDQKMPFYKWITKFQNLPAYYEAKRLYKLAIKELTFEFRVPKSQNATAKNIILHTREQPFSSGTSLSHVDQDMYTGKNDFLMRPRATEGKSLDQIESHKHHPIGPYTLDIFEAIGWSVVRDGNVKGIKSTGSSKPDKNKNKTALGKLIRNAVKRLSNFFSLP